MRFGIHELIFVLLAVPVASYIYVFEPRRAEIVQAEAENEVKRARLVKLEEMNSRLEDLNLEIDRMNAAVAKIVEKLPDERDVEGILEQIWQQATRNNLDLKSVKSQTALPASEYMELPLEVSMEGNFDGFYEFLIELEELARITRIQKMKLTRAGFQENNRNNNNNARRAASSVTSTKDEPIDPGAMTAEFVLSIYFEQDPSGR
jgi:type IV pilus assembly protein PilO